MRPSISARPSLRPLLAAFALVAVLPLMAAGCPPGTAGCACTMEYRTITVRVVDAEGAPVEGLQATVTNETTGRVLDMGEEEPFEPGAYLVATDAHTNTLSEGGDRLRFRAENDALAAEATFVVGVDDCRCHVDKRSGPAVITAQPR